MPKKQQKNVDVFFRKGVQNSLNIVIRMGKISGIVGNLWKSRNQSRPLKN